MKEYRWLLPFTQNLESQAISSALHLAETQGATLVPVALIKCSEKPRSQSVRLEYIQQATDFIEMIHAISESFRVAIESHEVFTEDILRCIHLLIRDLHCDGIVVASQGQRNILLSKDELAAMITCPPASLVLIQLGKQQPALPSGIRFLSWLRRSWQALTESEQAQTPTVVPGVDPNRLTEKQYSG